MADTAVDTTVTAEVTAKDLKEKKEVEVEEEKKIDNGDAPANGTNGADHSDKVEETAEEKHNNGDGNAEEAPPAEETDAQPVKRAAEEEEEEEKVVTKKQKTEENGDSKEAEVEA
ncbi:prothymosin alpha isoform X2 [Siniperca chuatsi]|uniref:prothymosin alpha isoform X2 n=1 Tax=Siniperca chuatsi TaxID=119488 RepID=UPI001CE1CFCA|nr:prothymosin alpha isoform X2 [Siniperca chuatsi]